MLKGAQIASSAMMVILLPAERVETPSVREIIESKNLHQCCLLLLVLKFLPDAFIVSKVVVDCQSYFLRYEGVIQLVFSRSPVSIEQINVFHVVLH